MTADPRASVAPTESTPLARDWALTLDRTTGAFVACAGVLIVIGGAVAAVDSAAPFDHGPWLAAYLVLVGGVSQILLAVGRTGLPAPRPAHAVHRAQLALWNLGSLVVPTGVLADVAAIVTVGSVALLAGLVLFARGLTPRGRDSRGLATLYLAFILGLAASVIVGSAIADAAPGAWL